MTTSTRPKPKFWALTGETAKAAVRLYFDPLHRIAGRGRGVEQEHVRTGVLEIVRVLVRQMRMELEVLTSTPFGGSDSKVEEVLLDLLEHELKTMAILTKTLAREQVLVRNRQFGLRHSLEQALQESEKQLSASDVEQAWELERAWELEQVLFEAQNSAQILKDVLWDK